MRLEFLPWPEVERVREEKNLLLVPVGATEQHGPHLPINTDTVIGERLCWAASEKTGVAVAPGMAYSVSAGHTPKWAGTFTVGHEAFLAVVRDFTAWAVATGWKRVVFLNAHLGNDAALRVAVDQLRVKFLGRLQIGVWNSFTLGEGIWDEFRSDAEDLHANRGETDLMLYLSPETVRMEAVVDDEDRTGGTVFSYPVAQTSLNGVTGRPSEGTADAGEALFGKMVGALVDKLERALVEEPPLPEGEWEGYDFEF
ncbi:MAG: creatininase family protein [Verrucomicrobiota bacterium]